MKNKILIVEDTLAVREEIHDILLMEGYTVFEAKDGIEGFEMALKVHPDLIISDILMPELNGFEMFKKLQKDKRTIGIPLIFLSAKGEKEDIRIGMNLGAEDYLTKPINVNDLVNAAKNKIKKKLIIEQRIIEETSELSKTLKDQKHQIENLSHLILDGIQSSQNTTLELLAWTQQELEQTKNFRDSTIKIDERWSKIGLTKQPSINTNAVVERVLQKVENPSHITISIVTELPHIFADEHLFAKVFEVLIQHAVEHIHNKIGLIEIGYESTEKEPVFSIKYNYLRIHPAHHKNIFEEFQIIESSESIGVGLNIVKKITAHYNGKISIKSIPNKETTFYFSLPKTTDDV
jgi:DNA-binding response OmpR family regulator